MLVLLALAACVLLVLLLRREAAPPRAPPRRGLHEGETIRDLPDLPQMALPEREPVFLIGHVYGPDGSPVEKAEVRVVYPKTFELVRSGEDGAYELPFDRHGRFLVEAALTIELAPERAWADVPEYGDPAPLDFRLKPAGAIFGEVTMLGIPVGDAGVELYVTDIFGDEELVHDTSARNGYFNFYFDPPKDAPLRLDVKSDEGLLRTPLRFTWRGEQMNAGRFDLVPYPSLRIRMRLPDGRYAPDVRTCRPEDLKTNGADHFPVRYLGTGSRVAIPADHDVTMRLVFVGNEPPGEEDPGEDVPTFMIEREVELAFGRPRELDLIVRPGPFVVTSRLVDERDRAVRARLRLGDRDAPTREDGSFQLAVPCGGLHTVRLAAMEASGAGWVDLDPDAPEYRLLLDADDPAECRVDLGGRVLALASVPAWVELQGPDSWKFSPYDPIGATLGRLSPKLAAGDYTWTRKNVMYDAEGILTGVDAVSRSGVVTVEGGILSVVDAR